MRAVTATEKLRAVNEGSMSPKEFVRQMRQQFPQHITQFNGFKDSVQILKNRGLLFEAKKEEVAAVEPAKTVNYSLDALERGIRIELESKGITTYGGSIKPEDFYEAEKKAKSCLEKNSNHYLDLMSGESQNVDKHDQEVEVKKDNHVDTFNGMKKAELKESTVKEDAEEDARNDADYEAGWADDPRKDESTDLIKEAGKKALIATLNSAIEAIKAKYGDIPGISGMIRDFLKTHIDDLAAGEDPIDNFENFIDVNYDQLDETDSVDEDQYDDLAADTKQSKAGRELAATIMRLADAGYTYDELTFALKDLEKLKEGNIHDYICPECDGSGCEACDYVGGTMHEKKGKDLDGDGDVDGDDYMHAKDKAIKKAMGKDEQLKEAIKAIITKTLSEDMISEAATAKLSTWGEGYEGFEGVKAVVNELENIVTEVEQFYEKIGDKIAKTFAKTADFTNEEGLKIGAFIAPSLEAAFNQDLRPVTKKGFTKKIELPKVRRISSAEIDAARRAQGDIDEAPEEPKQTLYTPNFQ